MQKISYAIRMAEVTQLASVLWPEKEFVPKSFKTKIKGRVQK